MQGPKEITSGAMGMSLTCSTVAPRTKQDIIEKPLSEWDARKIKVTEKGYVTLNTSMGVINLELDCDQCPLTCLNFITHCRDKYYDGTIFHRNIRNFMVQGGDPSHSGTGGNSIWGKPFPDELRAKLTHDGRGVLGMANAGKNTNGSQFYITYRSAHHLDNVNVVFGRVVGGSDTLDKMEVVQVVKDKPVYDIVLESTTVFVDPFITVQDKVDEKRKVEENKKREQDKLVGEAAMFVNSQKAGQKPSAASLGIGKYMNNNATSSLKRPEPPSGSLDDTPIKK